MPNEIDEHGTQGTSFEQVYGYKVIVVGASPNLSPSVRIEEGGVEDNVYKVSKTSGTVVLKSAHSAFTQVDTGCIHHTGDFNIIANNCFTVEAASGGILLETTGNTNIHSLGGITTIIGQHEVSLQGRVVSINASEAIDLRGPIRIGNSMDGEDDQLPSTIYGGLNIGGNMHVRGGAYINGELFCNHISTVQQSMFTEEASTGSSFINPYQNFTLYQGKSKLSKVVSSLTPLTSLWASLDSAGLPNTPGLIDAVIALPIPGMDILTVPCRIGFPNGVGLISDGLGIQVPEMINPIFTNSVDDSVVDLASLKKPDILGDKHRHEYQGPAIKVYKSSDKLWESATSVDEKKPVEALPAMLDGKTVPEHMEAIVDMQKKKGIDYLKNMVKQVLPPWLGGNTTAVTKD